MIDSPWGSQTEKSLKYFDIGEDRFHHDFLSCMLQIKRAMAKSNGQYHLLEKKYVTFIVKAIDGIEKNQYDFFFPVKIWQTGSGTQVNMNVNEVIAKMASKHLASSEFIHPNDHVNKSQSSNDVIPTALKLSAFLLLRDRLLPELKNLQKEFSKKAKSFEKILKVGRTHLMDAVPITIGQEFSAFESQIKTCLDQLEYCLLKLCRLPLGGTAVGTGINCPKEVSHKAIAILSKELKANFTQDENLFSAVNSNGDVLHLSSCLKNLSCSLLKISTDIALMSSGPDAGLNELILPANEAGSSIMPGKVNPTQCEALQMVCCEVMGNDYSVSIAETHGHFQLNTYRPLIIKNVLNSLELLSDSISSFNRYCLSGLKVNTQKVQHFVARNKMIGTLLAPVVGYDKIAMVVKAAIKNDSTIEDELEKFGIMNKKEFKKKMSLYHLVFPPKL